MAQIVFRCGFVCTSIYHVMVARHVRASTTGEISLPASSHHSVIINLVITVITSLSIAFLHTSWCL